MNNNRKHTKVNAHTQTAVKIARLERSRHLYTATYT